MRLPRQLLHTPSMNHALETMTLRHGNDVDHLVLLEDRSNLDRLLKVALRKLHFVRHAPAVDLDLH